MKKYVVFSLFSLIALASCRPTAEVKSIRVQHFNFYIVSDLTNRIEKKELRGLLHDTLMIKRILENFKSKVLPFRRGFGQHDILKFGRVSALNASYNLGLSEINLDKIETPNALSAYLFRGQLDHDLVKLNQTVRATYLQRQKYSGDIYSFFNRSLTKLNTKSEIFIKTDAKAEYIHSHRNILFLFTDGYIEAGNYDRESDCINNKCRFLSEGFISEIRNKVKSEGLSLVEIINKYNYGLIPLENPLLVDWEVIVLEMDDRSLKASNSASHFVTDYEITQILWRNWLLESGIKKVATYPVANDLNTIDAIIRKEVLHL
jgi:hypothetical protein